MSIIALLVLVLVLAGACGESASKEPGSEPALAPFISASARLPAEFHEERCADLRRRTTGLTLFLAVPDSVDWRQQAGAQCSYGDEGGVSMGLTLAPEQSVAEFRRRQLDPFEDGGGDDSVSRIRLQRDVTAFGGRYGDLLTWETFSDGSPASVRMLQSGGVRLTWSTPENAAPRLGDWQRVVDSVALLRSTTSLCAGGSGGSRTIVEFSPPVPQTESIDATDGRCHVHLQPGRQSLLRYAEVVVGPTVSLVERATRLRSRPGVSGVLLEKGAARLDGRLVDRLTWTVTRLRETQDHQPAGTWRLVTIGDAELQATWGATPEQWRAEQDVVHRFFSSIR